MENVRNAFDEISEEAIRHGGKLRWSQYEDGQRVIATIAILALHEMIEAGKDPSFSEAVAKYITGGGGAFHLVVGSGDGIAKIVSYNTDGSLGAGLPSPLPRTTLSGGPVSASLVGPDMATIHLCGAEGWMAEFRIHSTSLALTPALKMKTNVELPGMITTMAESITPIRSEEPATETSDEEEVAGLKI